MKQKPTLWKCLLAVVAGAFLLFAGIRWVIPFCRYLVSDAGRDAVYAFVENCGIFAPIAFIGLMAVQVVVAVIPGAPLEVASGALFGTLPGLLCSATGIFLGSLIVFLLVRKFGRPVVTVFVREKQMRRFSFLEDEEKLTLWVFVLFLIPGIPKDVLAYLVPLTRMRMLQYLLISTVARFPALVASVLIGDSLSSGRYWLSITVCMIAAVAVFAGMRIRSRFLKGHGEYK